jgi:hypothetical protein
MAGQYFEAIAADTLGGFYAQAKFRKEAFTIVRRNQAATERIDIGFLVDNKDSGAQAKFLKERLVLGEEFGIAPIEVVAGIEADLGDGFEAFAKRNVAEVAGGDGKTEATVGSGVITHD